MNCLSLNIRGIGACGKDTWVKGLRDKYGTSFLSLQETMCNDFNPGMMTTFWGGLGFDCNFVNANGHSGGLVSLWDPKVFVKDSVKKDSNFLQVSGMLADGITRFNILNVYAPQQNVEKRRLWMKLSQVMNEGQGWWIVLGDFNAVRSPEERKNSAFDSRCARDFNDFIDAVGLCEYDLKGIKYTFFVV